MPKRTTIEIDEVLLARAKRALGASTTRATVEEALRRATASAEAAADLRAEAERKYLQTLSSHLDLSVLTSDVMWR